MNSPEKTNDENEQKSDMQAEDESGYARARGAGIALYQKVRDRVRKVKQGLSLPNNSSSTLEHDFLPAALEVLEKPPAPLGRIISLAIMSFMIILVLWMVFAKMEVVVAAQGRVVPSGSVKVIQSADGGVIKAIHVRNGQKVEKGEVLLELDSTSVNADRERLKREFFESQVEFARLKAQFENRKELQIDLENIDPDMVQTQSFLLISRLDQLDNKLNTLDSDIQRRKSDVQALKSEIERLESTLPLLKKRYQNKARLNKKGFVSDVEMIDAELEVINTSKELDIQRHRLEEARANLLAAKSQRAQAEAEFRSNTLADLAEVAKRRESSGKELIKAKQRHDRQFLRAPVDGVVQQVMVSTVGGVVTAAEKLMVVVPDNIGLEVEAKILNKDVGFVEREQKTAVKINAFQFTKHGTLDGTIQWVATDAVMDEKLGPVFPARIAVHAVDMPNIVNGRRGRIQPGMTVTADIKIGSRRVIEYFLSPLLRKKEESLREI